MKKMVDERHCPNCGRGVISWDVVCPGCDQVPWDTPAGRQIIRRRRLHETFLSVGGLVGLFLIGVLGLMLWSWLGTHEVSVGVYEKAAQIREMKDQLRRASWSATQRERMLDHLVSYLKADEWITGLLAADVLLTARDKRAVPWLIQMVDHSDPEAARYARALLSIMSREDFGTRRDRWNAWWQAHQHEELPSIMAEVALEIPIQFTETQQ